MSDAVGRRGKKTARDGLQMLMNISIASYEKAVVVVDPFLKGVNTRELVRVVVGKLLPVCEKNNYKNVTMHMVVEFGSAHVLLDSIMTDSGINDIVGVLVSQVAASLDNADFLSKGCADSEIRIVHTIAFRGSVAGDASVTATHTLRIKQVRVKPRVSKQELLAMIDQVKAKRGTDK
jgi:hypothetical protein